MGVASLILGILGLVVFWWLGPSLGGLWSVVESLRSDPQQIVLWPVWTLGLIIGVGLPVISIFLGAVSMAKSENKGVGLGGIVLSAVASIMGFVTTMLVAVSPAVFSLVLSLFSPEAADRIDSMLGKEKASSEEVQKEMQEVQEQLDDPAIQQKLMQRLQKAGQEKQEQEEQKAE